MTQAPITLTPQEEALAHAHLDDLLQSPPFRNSKRYPRFLRKIVACTISGNFEELKERTLGHSVFDRPPDYDTNADPIVRITAGEVRKRLAQYYQEPKAEYTVRISLPVGAYIAEFRFNERVGTNLGSLDETEARGGGRSFFDGTRPLDQFNRRTQDGRDAGAGICATA